MERKAAAQKTRIQADRGPMEGMILVNGHPQMEASDMPCLSFDSPEAVLRFCEMMKSAKDPVQEK